MCSTEHAASIAVVMYAVWAGCRHLLAQKYTIIVRHITIADADRSVLYAS